MEMEVGVVQEDRLCNLLEFYWPRKENSSSVDDVFNILFKAFGSLGSAAPFLHSSAVIRSIDGSSIGCYEHWRKDTDFDHLFSTELAPVLESLEAVATHDSCFAEVVIAASKSGAPQAFSVGKVFYIAEYPLKDEMGSSDQPAHQDAIKILLSETAAFLSKQLLEVNELISFSISKAADDSRIVIMEEWASAAAAQKLAAVLTHQLPGSPLKDRTPSKSSNVYENIHIHMQTISSKNSHSEVASANHVNNDAVLPSFSPPPAEMPINGKLESESDVPAAQTDLGGAALLAKLLPQSLILSDQLQCS